MSNRPDPRFNPMMLLPYVQQPRMDGQFLINYTLHKKLEQLPGYETPHVSEIFDGKNEVVGLDRDVQQIMKKILKGLQGLHGVGWCHGNLLNGYWFNTDHDLNAEVRFMNFGGADDLAAGIKKNMKDFKDLLGWVIEANTAYMYNSVAQLPFWPPTDVHGFGKHVTELIHEMDLETLRIYVRRLRAMT
ncbi:uncharacterized protein LOC131323435 [Rhododendron vialii]|uniref:uncharacterized protein LOC131323435 n=1 Tax=Rhododendron vialii TaxID=182163 RepID=UPI00265EF2EC|nr:uncharacterized protein LOC131323435 [Rhododendron vialii]